MIARLFFTSVDLVVVWLSHFIQSVICRCIKKKNANYTHVAVNTLLWKKSRLGRSIWRSRVWDVNIHQVTV